MSNRPVIILGAGGHARSLLNVLKILNIPILGVTDIQLQKGHFWEGFPVLGTDEAVLQHHSNEVLLVNGLGSVASTHKRRDIFEKFKALGYCFETIIHPSSVCAHDIYFGEGLQIMAAAVVQPGAHIASNVLINTRAVVEHDCVIGHHVHVATGAILSGGVCIADGAHIGCGAVVIQNMSVGMHSLIGAGAVVVSAIADNTRAWGVPAKVISEKEIMHA